MAQSKYFKDISDYEPIIVNDIPCLFTNSRIERATLPENIHAYDIQGDGGDNDFVAIKRYVLSNRTGTILTDREISMTEGNLTPVKDHNFTDNEGSDKLLATLKSTRCVRSRQVHGIIGYGSLGNGYSVWDSGREENGEYKKLAHISRDRKLTYLTDDVSLRTGHFIEMLAQYHNGSQSESQPERMVLDTFGGSGFMSHKDKVMYLRALGCNEAGIEQYSNDLWDADKEPHENLPLFRQWWDDNLMKRGWTCTDSDTGQWARKIDDFTWDYFDNGDGPEDATRICVKDFKISTIESEIASFGYALVPGSDKNIQTIYGTSYLQIIAECLFETGA